MLAKAFKLFALAIVFVALGYAWAFFAYRPLDMAKEIKNLQANNQELEAINHTWEANFNTRMSQHFVEGK